jgi:hypothetical protein
MTTNSTVKSESYAPDISFDTQKGLLRIEGESYCVYTIEFFQPLFEELRAYLAQDSKPAILVEFKMTYFNTNTSRRFTEILSLLEDYTKTGGKAAVHWYYREDDGDILEDGEEFAIQYSLDFQCIPME